MTEKEREGKPATYLNLLERTTDLISLRPGRPLYGRYHKESTTLLYDFPRVKRGQREKGRHKTILNIQKKKKAYALEDLHMEGASRYC